MNNFADIEEFIITRKQRVMLAPFVCAICDRTIVDDEWTARRQYNKAPICGYCTGQWGRQMRPSKVTRGDYNAMQRLKAITERLNWEIHNGQRTKRSLTSW